MPLVVIYTSEEFLESLSGFLPVLRERIAKELTCGDRELKPEEVAINILVPSERLSIANVEIVINAHSYPDRVVNQDKICLSIKEFILSENSFLGSVFVWLVLSELGHSVKEN